MSDAVITRFAPSPTGFLHIGGARTALFNWLFARATGGKMLLRIEDTDRQRSTPEAISAILDGLSWLGLNWDGDTIYQFARAERHRQVAHDMLARGRAYRCYATAAELDEMRERATAEGRPPRYDGRWRDRDPAEAPAGVEPVIRLKAERDGETIVDDIVQGRVVIPNKDLDDLVLLRSDGNPTYMHAVVVDDHDMNVTHIIRGVDHLTNAARQIQIYRALDWVVPQMAHIPLIHGADGAKLSKRHGALGVDAYRAMGYLPEALRNYLVRLGWSHGDDEIFSTEDMTRLFTLPAIGKSAARFDVAKLENVNGHYIRTTGNEQLLETIEQALPHLPAGPAFLAVWTDEFRRRFLKALPGLKERAKTLNDLLDMASFMVAPRPLRPDEKAARLLDSDGRDRLSAIVPVLESISPFDAATIEARLKSHVETTGMKLGQIAQPLRAALTGRAMSPGIFDVLEALGQSESLARIKDQAA